MTDLVTEDPLARMRETLKSRKTRKAKKAWVAPTVEDFAHGSVLSFDQTLTKTGFSVVQHDSEGLRVVEGNLLIPKIGDEKGFEETYAKANAMEQAIQFVVIMLAPAIQDIVHEMPSVVGKRIESSLMAGHFVRRAALHHARGVPVHMVSNQTMKAILLPPEKRSEKKHVTQAVEALIPKENRAVKRWNQDVHDSVALGLAVLYQRARA